MAGFKARDAKRAEQAMHDHLLADREALAKTAACPRGRQEQRQGRLTAVAGRILRSP